MGDHVMGRRENLGCLGVSLYSPARPLQRDKARVQRESTERKVSDTHCKTKGAAFGVWHALHQKIKAEQEHSPGLISHHGCTTDEAAG